MLVHAYLSYQKQLNSLKTQKRRMIFENSHESHHLYWDVLVQVEKSLIQNLRRIIYFPRDLKKWVQKSCQIYYKEISFSCLKRLLYCSGFWVTTLRFVCERNVSFSLQWQLLIAGGFITVCVHVIVLCCDMLSYRWICWIHLQVKVIVWTHTSCSKVRFEILMAVIRLLPPGMYSM